MNQAECSALTPRETEVLALIANGKRTKEVAAALGMSFRTAVCHRGRIMSKLGCHNAVELTLHAIRIGLVRVESEPSRDRDPL